MGIRPQRAGTRRRYIEVMDSTLTVAEPLPSSDRAQPWLFRLLLRRPFPLALAVLSIVWEMGFSLSWFRFTHFRLRVHSAGGWFEPGDIWTTVHSAHVVAWGDLSHIYSYQWTPIMLPLFAILLAPVVMLSSHLHLTESLPYFLPRPTAWLFVGPYTMAWSGMAIYAFDALAERAGATAWRRRVLDLGVAGAVWTMTGFWGHPEDTVALGLVAYACVALADRRWARVAWLLGIAMAMQPLSVLAVPLALGVALRETGAQGLIGFIARASLVPGALLAVVLSLDWKDASQVLFRQPNVPSANQATPWMALAPKLGNGVVAAGPTRWLAVAVSLGVGWLAFRRRTDLAWWLSALTVAFAARCVFESVMDAYYLIPMIAFAGVAAVTAPRWRWGAMLPTAAALALMGYWRSGPWPWWLAMMAALVPVMALSLPLEDLRRRRAVKWPRRYVGDSSPAMAARMPFTKRPASSVEKRLHSSIASSIATAGGSDPHTSS
jgi:hypothetical protein